MPTISVISPKGGVGKSTAALLLGSCLAERGEAVTIIDTDAAQWIVDWASRGNAPDTLEVIAHPGENGLLEAIEDASKDRITIVDTEGAANMTVGYAVAASDLVIIPTQPSTLDGQAAANALNLVRQQAKIRREEIPTFVLLNKASPAIVTRTMRRLIEDLEDAGISVLKTGLVEREVFRCVWDYGCTLNALPKNEVSNLAKAIRNVDALVDEVLSHLAKDHSTHREASNG